STMLTNSSGSMTFLSCSRTESSLRLDMRLAPLLFRLGVFSETDPDAVIFYLRFVDDRRFGGWHTEGRAGADIELRPVTRTGDGVFHEFPFAQRAVVMGTDIVQAVGTAIHMKYYHE